jgi:copper chaperone CopZ
MYLTVKKRSATMDRKHITLPIEDFGRMGSGELAVERALAHVPGVLRVYVNPATEMAYVQFDGERCAIADLHAAVARAGFRVDGHPAP